MSQDQADIFISYAHLDDKGIFEDSSGSEEGWVSKFHKHLEPRLKTILGDKKVKIWRDNQLKGNDFFSDEIHTELSSNSVLVCIYSPSYLNSPWCGREVEFFSAQNSSSTSYKIGNKSRIFKVLKMKIDRDKEPEMMQKQLGYRFYGEKGVEYDISMQGEERNAYASKLTDLALDVAECLKLMMSETKKDSEENAGSKKVFLAESPDCVRERDEVKRELQAFGYQVLPDHQVLASQIEGYKEEMKSLIETSDFYVQLLGEEYGQRFPESEESTVKVQHDLIFQESKKSQKSVFTWIKKETDRSKSMKQFVQDFFGQVDKLPMEEGERIFLFDGTPVGKLNLEISEYIKGSEKDQKGQETSIEETGGIERVLLLYSEKDAEKKSFVPLYKHLVSKGLELKILSVKSNIEEREADFKDQIANSKAVVIFYGEGDEAWLSDHQQLLERHAKENLPKAIYTFEPSTLEKEILASSLYHIIDGLENADHATNEQLNGFVEKCLKNERQ